MKQFRLFLLQLNTQVRGGRLEKQGSSGKENITTLLNTLPLPTIYNNTGKDTLCALNTICKVIQRLLNTLANCVQNTIQEITTQAAAEATLYAGDLHKHTSVSSADTAETVRHSEKRLSINCYSYISSSSATS